MSEYDKIENFAVIDLGNTNTKIAFNFQNHSTFKKIVIRTSQDYNKQINAICSILKKNKTSRAILAIAAPIDFESNQLINPPNLRGYKNKKPQADFKKTGIEIQILNDLELAAIGEATYGAGKKYQVVAIVSMATGAGGALVKNREIVRGRYNFEAGQHIFESNAPVIPYKITGSFEAALSGSALRKITHQDPAKLPDSFYHQQIDRLSQILTNFSVFWSPEVIILTGPIAKRFQRSLPLIKKKLKKYIQIIPIPKVLLSSMGEDAALAGGYALMKKYERK